MPVVAPARPKASLQETSRGLELRIPARRNGVMLAFLALWLCGWAAGEIMVPTTFLRNEVEPGARGFTAAWLVMWTIGGGFALYAFFWSLLGCERVVLTPSSLAIKRELLGFGRVREYELAHIRDLRVAPAPYNPYDFRSGFQFWGLGGGVIAFDHGAATVRFGAALEEGEARSIVARLRERGPIAQSGT